MSDRIKQQALWDYCKKYITDMDIRSEETCCQADRVQETATVFIEGIFKIVGPHENPELLEGGEG